MFAITTLFIAGGLAYTGSIVYKRLQSNSKRLHWLHRNVPTQQVSMDQQEESALSPSLRRANRTLALSSVSLGITTAGIVLTPFLMLISVPAALVIFGPTLQTAWQTLRYERRVTLSVLDATRVTLCIVMGYYLALALDTWLRALTARLLLHAEDEFQQTLELHFADSPKKVWLFTDGAELQTPFDELTSDDVISVAAGESLPANGIILYGVGWIDERLVTGEIRAVRKSIGDRVFAATTLRSGQLYIQITTIPQKSAAALVRRRLEELPSSSSYIQQFGEGSGRRVAPSLLATFALLLPFWDANRAAGFLTTSFGNQMSVLGPHTLQTFATLAFQQNILILNGRALELLNLVNTVIFDAAIFSDPTLREQARATIYGLRQQSWPMQEVAPQRFAIYLLATGKDDTTKALAAELGVDDYFVEPLASARATLLERLRLGGRFICHIGDGTEDPIVMEKALVAVTVPTMDTQPTARFESTTTQIILLEKDLKGLIQLFTLARQFGTRQLFNMVWPLIMDLVDIGTTVFVHFGLTYSILFSYSGLLGSALYARLPLLRYQRQMRDAKHIRPIDPARQLESHL